MLFFSLGKDPRVSQSKSRLAGTDKWKRYACHLVRDYTDAPARNLAVWGHLLGDKHGFPATDARRKMTLRNSCSGKEDHLSPPHKSDTALSSVDSLRTGAFRKLNEKKDSA